MFLGLLCSSLMAIKKKLTIKPARSTKVPVTSGMLSKMESRLCHRMESGFHKLKAEVHKTKSNMHGIKSDLKTEIHDFRAELNAEEYVMDGYAQLYEMISARL